MKERISGLKKAAEKTSYFGKKVFPRIAGAGLVAAGMTYYDFLQSHTTVYGQSEDIQFISLSERRLCFVIGENEVLEFDNLDDRGDLLRFDPGIDDVRSPIQNAHVRYFEADNDISPLDASVVNDAGEVSGRELIAEGRTDSQGKVDLAIRRDCNARVGGDIGIAFDAIAVATSDTVDSQRRWVAKRIFIKDQTQKHIRWLIASARTVTPDVIRRATHTPTPRPIIVPSPPPRETPRVELVFPEEVDIKAESPIPVDLVDTTDVNITASTPIPVEITTNSTPIAVEISTKNENGGGLLTREDRNAIVNAIVIGAAIIGVGALVGGLLAGLRRRGTVDVYLRGLPEGFTSVVPFPDYEARLAQERQRADEAERARKEAEERARVAEETRRREQEERAIREAQERAAERQRQAREKEERERREREEREAQEREIKEKEARSVVEERAEITPTEVVEHVETHRPPTEEERRRAEMQGPVVEEMRVGRDVERRVITPQEVTEVTEVHRPREGEVRKAPEERRIRPEERRVPAEEEQLTQERRMYEERLAQERQRADEAERARKEAEERARAEAEARRDLERRVQREEEERERREREQKEAQEREERERQARERVGPETIESGESIRIAPTSEGPRIVERRRVGQPEQARRRGIRERIGSFFERLGRNLRDED